MDAAHLNSRHTHKIHLSGGLLLSLLASLLVAALAACTPGSATATLIPPSATTSNATAVATVVATAAPTGAATTSAMMASTMSATTSATMSVTAAGTASAAYQGPDWTRVQLTDARTGETFTLASYAGKTVFVRPMATWCTTCRGEIPKIESARMQLKGTPAADQIVFIGLSVAENVDNATLAKYVDDQGWNFRFAVAPDALTRGLVDAFGRSVVTPPASPHFIIRADGTLSALVAKPVSTDDVLAELKAAGGA